MRIGILSQKETLYSTSRLVAAAKERGHDVRVINYLRCYLNVSHDNPIIMYQGKPLEKFDAVIPRIAASYTFYGTAVVRQFELLGTITANGSQAISRARDKLRSLQILAYEGIGLPVTGFAHSTKDTEGLVNMVDGPPLVIKLIEGTQGIGVVLAETMNSARSMVEAFRGLSANILVQEFVQEAQGEDLRCFVVGDKVVAAMQRKARSGEFRANIHRGGKSEAVELTEEEGGTAIAAAQAHGLKVAGVDILRSKRGPLVLEVNSSPGLQGIENATKKDIASLIIEYLEQVKSSRKQITHL